MSHGEHTQRCRGWLEEQLASLAGMRNANPRDTEFKAWRQATMTTLQRVWPDEPARVERFRRIAFRAPGVRPEPEQIREWHRLGCELAHAYLTELVQDLDEHGAPVPVARTPDAARADGGVAEDDFPVVELHDGESRVMSTPSRAYEDNVIDLGGPAGELEPAQGRAADADSAPPTLRIELPAAREAAAPAPETGPTPPTLHAAPAKAELVAPAVPVAPAPADAAPGPTAAAPHPKPAVPKATPPASKSIKTNKKASAVTRLKDMLDFSKLEAQLAKDDAKAAQQDDAPAPAAEAPAPQASSVFATQPRPLKRNPKPVESLESLVPESLRQPAPAAPEPVAATEAPAAPAPDPALDADTFAAAADEFMRSSVVMSLTGKPVQRMSDATSFMDPDAVAVAALASDVGRLGVSEGSRGSMRAMLFDLARNMDAGSLEWAMLRDAVAQAMESPELARRLLPVVLPWLDRAA
jgi:hypothetical protein